jgi:hypothetical protein
MGMSRYKEPPEVVAWRRRGEPPRCCHTCENYSEAGRCVKYDSTPPEDFAAQAGACPAWEHEIPF